MAKTRRGSRKASSRKAARKASSRKAGRKASRKQSGGASEWNKAVMRVYGEMKRKDSNVRFGDALKEASKRKKAGNL
jgi:hypothetical protein